MRHLHFGPTKLNTYKIAILVNNIRKDDILKEYIHPYNINPLDVIIIDLHQSKIKKKTPSAEMKAYINDELQNELNNLNVEYILVSNSDYFKTFTQNITADKFIGYILDSSFGSQKVAYVPSFTAVFYDPQKVRDKISISINAVLSHISNTYTNPGEGIIKFEAYPETISEIRDWLDILMSYPMLTSDIEGFSLKHVDAGIGTISFGMSQEEGIAFSVDYGRSPEEAQQIRALLKDFFINYKGTLIWHSISFDVYILIYQLFMNEILDQEGLLNGLEIMLANWHDTKLITYLATNSCSGNKLGLKEQAQEYAGNYAIEEIEDITKIPVKDLLRYNLIDSLSTWYVYNKHYPTMIADNQLTIYNELFKPAIIDIIQMQLTGMPVDMERVLEVEILLQADSDNAAQKMNSSSLVQQFNYQLLEDYVDTKNSTWVKKRTTITDTLELAKTNDKVKDEITFNPNSGPKLQALLYEQLRLPVISTTKNKEPSTDAETLVALKNHTNNPDIIAFLEALIDYKSVDKILTSVIPALKGAYLASDGWHYLFGNFNLGGTLSGRLSSSKPNLQNLPATGTKYAKLIKSCFKAPIGWFFCGIDFNSLEDKISALTTKDPNKIKVYTDGYDGHSLRAYAYFGDQMTGIIDGNVQSINSIQNLYKPLRQESKAPTFALTYQGTYRTLMVNCGFSETKALMIEQKYHELYQVSDQWVASKLDQAMIDGYVTVAFGLRLRTPLLKQVIRGTNKTPHEAEAEGRTAGNALGQSWCMLNSRAASEFMSKVRKSEFRLDIKPCSQIHDAQYMLIRDNIDAIHYSNINVVKACEWQNHPDIAHPDVKLGGEFSIFYPTWDKEFGIPNNASKSEIYKALEDHLNKLNTK